MRSAAVLAEQAAEQATLSRLQQQPPESQDIKSQDTTSKPTSFDIPTSASDIPRNDLLPTTIQGAAYTDGHVYLRGNPLRTISEIYCSDCKLPRLLYPTTGIGARPPPDPDREYCAKRPFINKPGHDVHGQPFPTDKISSKKKKKKATAANGAANGEAGAGSDSDNTTTSTPPNSQTQANGAPKKAPPIEKPTYPTVKCPNCPRYLVVTRIAQHLDKCLGISGRQSSRNAMNKMQSTTPRDGPSRAGTPKPGANGNVGPKEVSTALLKKGKGKRKKGEGVEEAPGEEEEDAGQRPIKKMKGASATAKAKGKKASTIGASKLREGILAPRSEGEDEES